MSNIKKMRDAAGLTQKELAANLKVQQSTVAMWETGESMPRAGLLPALAQILNCTIDDLFAKDAPVRGQKGRKEETA